MSNISEGCANDKVKVCSVQSYVKNERGELNSAKYSPVVIGHDSNDIILKAVTYDIIKDQSGKIVERKDSKTRASEGLTH